MWRRSTRGSQAQEAARGSLRDSVAAIGGKLYAVGGIGKGGKDLSSVERFDPESGAWEDVASMGLARALNQWVGVAVLASAS